MYRNFDVLAEARKLDLLAGVRKLDVLAEVRKLDLLAGVRRFDVLSGIRERDVLAEVRKLTSSKPVYAAAGAGLLASQALWGLPGLIVRWGADNPVASLPARATGYVQTARARAADGYDVLADRGKQALGGPAGEASSVPAAQAKTTAGQAKTTAGQAKTTAGGRPESGNATRAKGGNATPAKGGNGTRAKSTPATRGKTSANGKAKPASRTAASN